MAGDVWIAGNIAFYGAERPSVFIDADPAKSPWITPAALARQGAVLIWPAAEARRTGLAVSGGAPAAADRAALRATARAPAGPL